MHMVPKDFLSPHLHIQQLFIHVTINSWWAKYIEKTEKI